MPTMCQVTLRSADSIPANYVQNQICMGHPDGDGPDPDVVTAGIKAFYDEINGPLLSSLTAQNDHLIKFYALPGTPPNYPYTERTFNLASAPAGNPLPSECALVTSFQGSRAAGFPQARRRGRLYIGPLDATVNSVGRPSSGAITALVDASENLYEALSISINQYWAIWSTVDQEAVQVLNGWVDNAFDTQRRRGVGTTSRTTLEAP